MAESLVLPGEPAEPGKSRPYKKLKKWRSYENKDKITQQFYWTCNRMRADDGDSAAFFNF